ncbi:MAG: hypothetical protein V1898_02975 [Patescibacteria group bacterium]
MKKIIITLFIFLPLMTLVVGCSSTTTKSINTTSVKQEEKKFGYTEAERKKIYKEIIAAEEKADKESSNI